MANFIMVVTNNEEVTVFEEAVQRHLGSWKDAHLDGRGPSNYHSITYDPILPPNSSIKQYITLFQLETWAGICNNVFCCFIKFVSQYLV